MFNVSFYLEKFKKLEPSGNREKNAAEEVIFESVGVKIEKNSISVSNGVLYLTVSPSLKNEIYMNKKNILRKIKERLGDGRIQDIR